MKQQIDKKQSGKYQSKSSNIRDKPKRYSHKRLKVLIIIPQKLYQNGISSLLKRAKDINVKEAAQNWVETIKIIERMKPHVVILSLEIPSAVRTIFLSFIRDKFTMTRVLLVCSEQASDEEIIQALSEGANGYVLTQTGGKELLKAIRNVYEGQIWAPRRMMGNILERLRNNNSRLRLSSVDKNVALLLADGLSDKEIAQHLNLSFFTIREHLSRVYHFLGVTSRSQAIVKLLKTRLPPQS
ncbi:MAG: LuxR C-terminal-related transcriptional regulator [bacterium]